MIDKAEFRQKYSDVFNINSLGQFVSDELIEKFRLLTEHMLEINAHMNLTAITDLDGVILKHYADSLSVAALIPSGARVIDVGCGAGFPSLPLAIARPDVRVIALDSTAKRINYINETAEILHIDNISAVTGRAEDFSKRPDFRESFDISCARAVAKLNVLCELCLPYVKTGGSFIAMKANADEELDESVSAIQKLGGKFISAQRFNLTEASDGVPQPRCLVRIAKISPTPKIYPRNNSQISKKPL